MATNMRLSIFTTATRPQERGDLWIEAMGCYRELADQVIVTGEDWPVEFSWEYIGQKFQEGYDKCFGDWVFHMDLDFIFHETDYDAIYRACKNNPDAPALSFLKYQFIQPDRYNIKSRLVIAVNKKKYGDRIKFDSAGDKCQPSLDGKYIEPGTVPDIRIPFMNYEKILKTKTQVKDDVERMARAWTRHFKDKRLGTTETAYAEWLQMQVGRYAKPHKQIGLTEHPKVMQETIRLLKPEQFGYDGFNHFRESAYHA